MGERRISRRRFVGGASAATLLLAGGAARADAELVVETTSGKVRGARSGHTRAFKGIPYGEDTGNGGRFRAPRPPTPWTGIRDALEVGSPCIQDNPDSRAWVDATPGSEDCLCLNVWTPGADPGARRPVMVWIHGGYYTTGSGGLPIYDGRALAESGDVVVVTVNHRLNIFGYLWLGDLAGEYAHDGNPGQRDLVAALGWVRDNIAAFGGDPHNVTLFGESGGGAKISVLLATPTAKGLFHKAIIESGSQIRAATREDATRVTLCVLDHLGLDAREAATLATLPAARLRAAALATRTSPGELALQPVVDGEHLPHPLWAPAAARLGADVPLIIGTNRHEAAAFLVDMQKPVADDAELRRRYLASFGTTPLDEPRFAALLSAYRRLLPRATRLELLVAMATDDWMWNSAIKQAERTVAEGGAPVFMYEFAWRTPCFGGQWALHGIEIPFVFGNLDYGSAWDGEDTDAGRAAADPRGDRFRLARRTLRAWVAFARHGNPSTRELPWPAYDLARRSTLVFDRDVRTIADPNPERRALVRDLDSAW